MLNFPSELLAYQRFATLAGARLNVLASAECYAQNTSTGVVTMDVTAQKSGYSDTTLGTYRHEVRSVAISNNCF